MLKLGMMAAVCAGALGLAGAALADPIPPGWQASGVEPIGFTAVSGGRAFKLTMKQANGRWYLFVASGRNLKGTAGFEVLDVTNPADPQIVKSVEVEGASGQITLHGDLMILGHQKPFTAEGTLRPYDGTPAEDMDLVSLWDVKDPINPRRVSSFRGKGWGTHRNNYPGGKYAYVSAWVEGYRGQTILIAVDVSDPANPKEAWRWWMPGQRDDETPIENAPMAYHGPPAFNADGTITLAYAPKLVNLDVSGPQPRVIGELMFSPLSLVGPPSLHTAANLPGGFVHVTAEPVQPGCDRETMAIAVIVDNRNKARPRLVSNYPRPIPASNAAYKTFCDKEGRFGPHNVNAETQLDYVTKPDRQIFLTYFSAGLRVFDVSDVYAPKETGWFLPNIGSWASGARGLEDVLVDSRGNIFSTSGRESSVWVLRYTGPQPGPRVQRPDPASPNAPPPPAAAPAAR